MRYVSAILVGVIAGYAAYSAFLFVYRWLVARTVRNLQRTQLGTIRPVVPPFVVGGLLAPMLAQSASQLVAGISMGSTISQVVGSLDEEPEPLVETWSNEKIEAWRVIDITMAEGNDGMWLGHPHPDGPAPPVVIPVRHPVGVELHAECGFHVLGMFASAVNPCDDVPGEHCQSSIGYGCGFYAFKTRDQADKAQLSFGQLFRVAVARVLLSGKVIEHADGYRAEILEVVEIEPPVLMALFGLPTALATFRLQHISPGNPFVGPNIISGGT